MLSLDGKAVLVTGSCQGLGEAIARACRQAGARVVLTGLPSEGERGALLAEELHGDFIAADLASEDACRSLVRQSVAVSGRLDCLVNCAAINPRATLLTTTAELYTTLFKVNLLAPFILTQEFAKARLAQGLTGGSIVNIGSVQAHCGAPFSMAYSSLKGALVVQTKNNASELREHRIRCNCILPGWMPTANEDVMQRSLGAPHAWVAHADAAAPLGRLLRPGDCAAHVVFLLSDTASMTTGTAIELHPEMITGSLPTGVGETSSRAKL